MARIGIYGGSFNPVHNGHVLAAEEFVRAFHLDRLLVIPTGVSPHKELADGSPSPGERAQLLRLAIAHIPQAEVDETELHRKGKSYTYDTLLSFRQRFPGDELFLLIGTDMFLSFREWYRFADILKLAALVVFQRKTHTEEEQRLVQRQKDTLTSEFGADIVLYMNDFVDVSSTLVRRMLLLGCGAPYLPAAVYDRILEKGLYLSGCNLTALSLEELHRPCRILYDTKRFQHAVGCSKTAVALAKLYGASEEDAARAGILHDITKALGTREQLHLCEKYAIITDDYCGEQIKILHGKTASAAAKQIFGENDAVCRAISWHTTGKADMSLLEKIIYIADYVEPTRDFDGVDVLRTLAFADLDAAVYHGICMTIDLLRKNNRSLNRHSVEARDFLAAKGMKI